MTRRYKLAKVDLEIYNVRTGGAYFIDSTNGDRFWILFPNWLKSLVTEVRMQAVKEHQEKLQELMGVAPE